MMISRQSGVLSFALVLVSLGFTGIPSPAPAIPWTQSEQKIEAVAIKVAQELRRGGYQLLSVAELKEKMDAGQDILIIDTMPYEASYTKAHIPGAVQLEFPIEETLEMAAEEQAKFVDLLGQDPDRILVFYCGFTECGRSHNGAMWAKRLGYTRVYRTPGGIQAWQEAGYPVERGE